MKKKTAKLLSVILALMLIVCTAPNMALTSFATVYNGTCGNNLTWQYNTSTYTLTISGAGAMTGYSYSNYNGTSTYVTTAPWRSYYNTMKTVVINSGVTSIGSFAFYGCTGLTSITIPNSVTSMGSSAFEGCTGLTSITIPNSVTSIGFCAFSDCTGLTSVTIPDSVTSIWSNSFFNTAWFNNQPDGLVYVGKAAYAYKGTCPSSVTIKEGTVGIAGRAFSYCTGLTSVTIPDSVLTIGDGAFPQSTVIYGTPSTAAEIFAINNGNKFIAFPDYIKVFYVEKTDYYIGSTMDPDSVIIAVYFADGEVKLYYKNFTVSGFDTSKHGKKTVTVSYLGKEATFDINVFGATANDLTVLVDMILGKESVDIEYDYTGDGNVNILDLIKMKKEIANM